MRSSLNEQAEGRYSMAERRYAETPQTVAATLPNYQEEEESKEEEKTCTTSLSAY